MRPNVFTLIVEDRFVLFAKKRFTENADCDAKEEVGSTSPEIWLKIIVDEFAPTGNVDELNASEPGSG